MILRITPKGDTVALIDEQSGKKYIYEKESIYYPKNNNDGTLSIMNSLTNRPEIDSLPASNWRSSNGNVIATGPDPLINGNFVYLGLTTAFNPPLAPPPNNLGNLNDVNLDGLSLGNVISYNAFNQSWENIPRLSASDFTSSSLTISGGNGLPISLEGGGQWTDINNDIYYINPDAIDRGYVGIGTSSPAEKLDVSGNAVIRGGLNINDQFTFPSVDGSTGQVLSTNGSGVVTWVDQSGGDLWTESGSNIYYSSGNVGIGTTSPSAKLDVVGNIKNDGQIVTSTASGNSIAITNQTTELTANYNTLIGIGIGRPTTGTENTMIGNAQSILGTSNAATMIGRALTNNGGSGVMIGKQLTQNTGAGDSVLIGYNKTSLTAGTVDIGYGGSGPIKIKGNADNSGIGIGNSSCASYGVSIGTSAQVSQSLGVALGHPARTTNGVSIGGRAGQNNSTGTNNTLIGTLTGYGDATSNFSNTTAVGYQALTALTTGTGNTALGYQAGNAATTQGNAVLIGRLAGGSTTNVGNNVFIGATAGNNWGSGDQAVAIGNNAAGTSASGQHGVFIGAQAGAQANGTDGTVAVGWGAGFFAGGYNNVLVGKMAGYGSGASTYANTVAVGYQALTALTTGAGNTALGYQAGDALTTGAKNTLLGYSAGTNLTGSNNTVLGYEAGLNATGYGNQVYVGYRAGAGFSGDDDQCVMVGSDAGGSNMGAWGVGVGFQANYNTSGYGIVGVGYQTNRTNTGAYSIGIGLSAGYNSSGENSIRIGKSSGYSSTGANTIAIGADSLKVTTVDNTVAVGYQALTALTTGTGNTAIGYQAGDGILAGTQNTLIGYNADIANVNGAYNVIVGDSVSTNSGGNYATRVGSIGAVGNQAVSIGYGAGSTSGNGSISIGYNAGKGNGTFNVYIGTSAGEVTGGSDSVGIGYLSNRWTTGGSNVSIGREAAEGDATSTFSSTTAVGYQALTALTTGAGNTAVGYQAGAALTTNSSVTAVGYQAAYQLATGNDAVAIGYHALENLTTVSGDYGALAIGVRANESKTSLANSTSIGNRSNAASEAVAVGGGSNASGAGATAVGHFARAGDYSTVIGYGAGDHFANVARSVLIGRYAGGTNVNSDSVMIGHQAGSQETGTHKLYIENSNSTTPLIYGEFDNDILRVNGELQVGDPIGTGFKLPTTDGTTGQVLSTDGSGAVTWVDQSGGASDAEIQLAYKTTDQTLTTTFTAITAWDGEYYDDQAAFDPTTGTLTITQAGTYFIQADVVTYCTVGTSRSSSEVYLEFNGSEVAGSRRGMYNRLADNGTTSVSIAFPYKHTTGTATFKLIAGQIAGSDTVVVSNAFFSSITLGGAQGAQGVSGDAFQVASETSGRTLVAGDHLNYIRNTSATAVTYTVPPQSSVSWVDNAEIVFEQAGAGQITIAAGSGVTINSSETLKSGQQYAVIGLKRVASDVWTLTGERELA